MKTMGIVRCIDGVGRIVLPIELRKQLDLAEEGSQVEITANGREIVLRKFVPACIFCNNSKGLTEFKGQKICSSCRKKINDIDL